MLFGRLTRIVGYITFVIVLSAIWLWVRFPAASVSTYAEQVINKLYPQLSTTIEGLQFNFPSTITIQSLQIQYNNPQIFPATIKSNNISLQPRKDAFPNQWMINGEIYGGTFEVLATYHHKNKQLDLEDIQAANITMSEIPDLQNKLQRDIDGIVNFKAKAAIGLEQPYTYSCNGITDMHNLSIELLAPIFSMHQLQFDTFTTAFSFFEDTVIINDGGAVNKNFSTSFTGKVNLNPNRQDQGIQIEGNMAIRSKDFLDRILNGIYKNDGYQLSPNVFSPTYHITGTLKQPNIVLRY